MKAFSLYLLYDTETSDKKLHPRVLLSIIFYLSG